MNTSISSKMTKYLESHIDYFFEIVYGDSKDEYDELYSHVYKYEIDNFISDCEHRFRKLESMDEIFNVDIIKNVLIFNFFDDTTEKDVITDLHEFSLDMLKYALGIKPKIDTTKEKDEKHIKDNNLTEDEYSYLVESVHSQFHKAHCYLTSWYIHKNDNKVTDQFVDVIKNTEFLCKHLGKKFTLIDDYIKQYINSINLYYKITGEIPYERIENVEHHYGIKRSDLVF